MYEQYDYHYAGTYRNDQKLRLAVFVRGTVNQIANTDILGWQPLSDNSKRIAALAPEQLVQFEEAMILAKLSGEL